MNKKYLKLGCIVRVPHQPWQCKTSLDLTNSGKFQSLDSNFVEFASIDYSAHFLFKLCNIIAQTKEMCVCHTKIKTRKKKETGKRIHIIS